MNTGQMLLVLGATALLSLTMLSVHEALVEHEQASIEGAFQLVATSLGQALIEEAIGKLFDQVLASDVSVSTLPWAFTAPGWLGPRWDEYYPNFNDVDDFHGYSRTYTAGIGVDYTISAQVEYVDGSNPGGPARTWRTFFKRVRVTVSSPYLSNDTVLQHVVSYWD